MGGIGSGRTPKPIALKALQGTRRANRERATLADVPAAQLGRAKMPRWLGRYAREFWRENAPALEKRGLLTGLDQHAFAALCAAFQGYREASSQLDREGLTVQTSRGQLKPHPAVRIRAQYERAMVSMMAQFGLTPATRSRMPAPPVEAAESPFAAFLRDERQSK